MTAWAWIGISAIVAATVWSTVRYRKTVMRGLIVVPLFGFGAASVVLYFAQHDADQAAINHTNCVNRHDGRANDRAMWFALTDRLEARGLPDDASFLRITIDQLKPDISKEKCP